jgi:hypothetical protein
LRPFSGVAALEDLLEEAQHEGGAFLAQDPEDPVAFEAVLDFPVVEL